MPCSAILTGHRLYTRPGTPEVPGLGPPRRVALGDIFGGEVPLVGVEAELAACGGLRKMGKEKRGRGRMGSAHVETASSRFGLPVGRASAPTAGSKSEHTNGLVMPIHCRKALQRQGQADQPLDSRGIGTSKCGQSSLELCCKGE